MELLPNAYFELDGEGFEFVGVQKNPAESQKVNVVARLDSGEKDAALHRIIPIEILEERGSNFWNLGEKLDHAEFRQQYKSQTTMLENTGILETLSSGEKGIVGIDGKEYPIPQFEQVRRRIMERTPELKGKVEQGFDTLLLVPLAIDLTTFIFAYKDGLLKRFVPDPLSSHDFFNNPSPESNLYSENVTGEKSLVDLDIKDPVNIENLFMHGWSKFELVDFTYYGDKSKLMVLEESSKGDFPGWRVVLVQDFPNFPFDSSPLLQDRPQAPAGSLVTEYLESLKANPLYFHEQGMILEEYFTYALTCLETKNQVIDYCPTPNRLKSLLYNATVIPNNHVRERKTYPKICWNYFHLYLGAETNDIISHSNSPSVARSVVTI